MQHIYGCSLTAVPHEPNMVLNTSNMARYECCDSVPSTVTHCTTYSVWYWGCIPLHATNCKLKASFLPFLSPVRATLVVADEKTPFLQSTDWCVTTHSRAEQERSHTRRS